MSINWQSAWNYSKDKIIGGVVAAIVIAVLAFAVGLLQLPEKLSKVEELTTRIPTIETSVAELRANQQTFNKLTEQAATTAKDFNQEVKQLTAANAKLEASIETLSVSAQTFATCGRLLTTCVSP
jgi:methyl-accepting chemotaxis protein